MKFLLATTNEGKIREYRHLLGKAGLRLAEAGYGHAKAGVEFVTLVDVGITEKPEETGETCEENAILKAKFYYEKSDGMPTLADDGGLEIDELGGEPGVHSRRWPGYEAIDEELVDYTLEKMKGIPQEKRGAKFIAVLAIAVNAKQVCTFRGELKGRIAEEPHYPIVPGYPFRSIFYEFKTRRVLSELPLEELPNGHREQAVVKALPYLLSL